MQKKNTKAKIRLSFIAAILCIGFFVLITYRNMVLTESESRSINSSLQVLQKLQNILIDVQDIETGQRGFMISGNEKFLDSYFKGLDNLKKDTINLIALNAAEPPVNPNYSLLLNQLAEKVKYSKYAIELRRVYGLDSAAAFTEKQEGLVLMNNIRSLISELSDQDRVALQQSSVKRDRLSQKRAWQLFSLAIIFYIILYINYRVINRDFIRQQKSERLLRYNASLIGMISDAIVTTDQEYKITNWNKYAQQVYGYSEEEVLGQSLIDLLKITKENGSMNDVIETFTEKNNGRASSFILISTITSSM